MLNKASAETGGDEPLPAPQKDKKPKHPDILTIEDGIDNQHSGFTPATSRTPGKVQRKALGIRPRPRQSPEIYNIARLHRATLSYSAVLYKLRDNVAVMATLIATFTFAAGINPPGGVYQDGPLIGTSVAARRMAFRVFFVCNNVALFASLCVVMLLLSMDIVSFKRKALERIMVIGHTAMWMAIVSMAAAYVAASVLIMRPQLPGINGADWTAVVVLSLCGGSFSTVFIVVGFAVLKRSMKKIKWLQRTFSNG